MAFGDKAEKFVASPKAVKFSQHFRKSFSVEEITMCNVEAEEETSTGKKTSLAEETSSTEVLKEITNLVGIADDQTSGRNLASQKAIEYSLHRKHCSEEMTFDLESDEETSLTGNKRSNAVGGKSKKDFKNTDGLTCSTSLSVAQPSGTNKGIVEEISSQGEVLKRKRKIKEG
ncbi:hypothetical protein DAPPUDRAFT_330851 [Daphnia pulex]|uniref:Uncharacterized protein n=1 Tax=Daphnia pulex TaxID=6669 RepID=E9HKT4_DAPPU|nr:hypothetical protein DAPPUDRAFT_330851 [Daphnia pulex]|eukprot:EFX67632.1 hypothetical protein DAPPUDRAFT_330851 [Daphnia pulex]